MILYNVTINIHESVHDKWMNWMQEKHINDVLATGKFSSARMVKVLVEEEMGGMLLESIKNAKTDMEQRAIIEARVEAQNMLDTCERFIVKNATHLSAKEISGTRELMVALQNTLNSSDKNVIQQHIEALNEFTRPFAERLMDMAISMAMKGKTL